MNLQDQSRHQRDHPSFRALLAPRVRGTGRPSNGIPFKCSGVFLEVCLGQALGLESCPDGFGSTWLDAADPPRPMQLRCDSSIGPFLADARAVVKTRSQGPMMYLQPRPWTESTSIAPQGEVKKRGKAQ